MGIFYCIVAGQQTGHTHQKNKAQDKSWIFLLFFLLFVYRINKLIFSSFQFFVTVQMNVKVLHFSLFIKNVLCQ